MSLSRVKVEKFLIVQMLATIVLLCAVNLLAAAEADVRATPGVDKSVRPFGDITVPARLLAASDITNLQAIVECAIGTHAKSSEVLRRASIRALIGQNLSSDQRQAIEVLRPLLTNSSELVRSDALALFISMGETNRLDQLRGLSLSAERSLVRVYAVDALADVGDFSSWNYVRKWIDDGDAYDLHAALPVAAKYLKGEAVPESDWNLFVRVATRGDANVDASRLGMRRTYFRVVTLLEPIETGSAESILTSLSTLAANESEGALVRDTLAKREEVRQIRNSRGSNAKD